MDYCIPIDAPNATQQCGNCRLIDGQLFNNGGHPFPNCPGTIWVEVPSWLGTNGTPVYQIVSTPLDTWVWVLLGISALVGLIIIRKHLIKTIEHEM